MASPATSGGSRFLMTVELLDWSAGQLNQPYVHVKFAPPSTRIVWPLT
jgi:hypothetical protein